MTDAVFTDVSGKVRLVGSLTGATLADLTPRWSDPVTLTSVEILALETTSKTLIAAPGSGVLIAPLAVALNYRYGTVAYTGDTDKLAFGFGATVATVIAGGLWTVGTALVMSTAGKLFAQTANASAVITSSGGATGWLDSNAVNKAFGMAMNDGAGFAAGDGTLVVRVLHALLDTTV